MELSAFLQYLKRQHHQLPQKYAVSSVGMQPDNTWVLGKDAYFTENGEYLSVADSKHIWIGDMYEGKGVAAQSQQCIIRHPLTTTIENTT